MIWGSGRSVANRLPVGVVTRRYGLHTGRATSVDTREFLARSENNDGRKATLRINGGRHLELTPRGVGSPYFWAKDVPRIESSKQAIVSLQSNFLQASINPYIDGPTKKEHKQSYVESLVLNEVIEDEGIPREALVVTALLEDTLTRPAEQDPGIRLSSEYIEKGVEIAISELTVEALDHVVVRLPGEFIHSDRFRSSAKESLDRAASALESLCRAGKIQSYGFALPASPNSSDNIDVFLESSLFPLAVKHGNFASLQLPMSIGSALIPLPASLVDFKQSRDLTIIADRVFETSLPTGKPFVLRSYSGHLGEDIALLLKSAFNLAISIERKYMEKILPDNSSLNLPSAEDVAWAHILANQHSQFDNMEEWVYIRETQIMPRFEITVKQFEAHEELKEFGFAYSMALRELLKYFSASVELVDASRAENLIAVLKGQGIVSSNEEPLEHIAVKTALAAGADIVLFEEQLGKNGLSLAPIPSFSNAQLVQIQAAAHSIFNTTE